VYSFVACGASATIEHYLISPTAEAAVSDATSTGNTEVSTSNKGESAATAAGDPAAQDTKDSKQNTGAIIGGVIGGLALVSIAVLAGIYMLRKNNRQQSTDLPADGIVYEAGNNEVYEPSKPEHQLRASEMSAPHSGGRTDCLSALME
jgi:predicted lipid-binding transport protein (Tim44 family)